MALQLSKYETVHGINLPDAHAQIMNYNGDVNNMRITLHIYKDAGTKLINRTSIEEFEYSVPKPDMTNLVEYCYKHLLTLEEFKTAKPVADL